MDIKEKDERRSHMSFGAERVRGERQWIQPVLKWEGEGAGQQVWKVHLWEGGGGERQWDTHTHTHYNTFIWQLFCPKQ